MQPWIQELKSDECQDLVEYALLASLIALVAATAVQSLGVAVRERLWDVINEGLFR